MKRIAKRLMAMLLAAVMSVSGLVAATVTAGAKGVFDDAVKVNELECYSKEFTGAKEDIYYKIALPKAGQITIRCADASGMGWTTWCLLNSGADEIDGGNLNSNFSYITKDLEKGTYYLRVVGSVKGAYIKDLYYTFTPNKKPVISFSATIKKGTTLQLGAVTENYDGKVTWSSAKKSVATVSSKGLVTAKKAGTAYIRAKMDNGDYVEIKIVVKKK